MNNLHITENGVPSWAGYMIITNKIIIIVIKIDTDKLPPNILLKNGDENVNWDDLRIVLCKSIGIYNY